jgi:hypothetical protein
METYLTLSKNEGARQICLVSIIPVMRVVNIRKNPVWIQP